MKKIVNIFAFALSLALPAAANQFSPPIPLEEDAPMRVVTGVVLDTKYKGLSELGTGVSFTHLITDGLHWGATLAGGVASGNDTLFKKGSSYNPAMGLDLMIGYWPMVTESFSIGATLGGQYWHGLGKATAGKLGFFDARLAMPLSFMFTDNCIGYIEPGLGLWSANATTGLFLKRNLGFHLDFGMEVGLSDAMGVLVSANAYWDDARKVKDIGSEYFLGLSFHI